MSSTLIGYEYLGSKCPTTGESGYFLATRDRNNRIDEVLTPVFGDLMSLYSYISDQGWHRSNKGLVRPYLVPVES